MSRVVIGADTGKPGEKCNPRLWTTMSHWARSDIFSILFRASIGRGEGSSRLAKRQVTPLIRDPKFPTRMWHLWPMRWLSTIWLVTAEVVNGNSVPRQFTSLIVCFFFTRVHKHTDTRSHTHRLTSHTNETSFAWSVFLVWQTVDGQNRRALKTKGSRSCRTSARKLAHIAVSCSRRENDFPLIPKSYSTWYLYVVTKDAIYSKYSIRKLGTGIKHFFPTISGNDLCSDLTLKYL